MRANNFFRDSWSKDLILLLVGIGLFYFLWLGSYPLFTPDEGRYSEVAREMVATGDYITPRVNGVVFLDKPVLYYWLQAAAIFLFGVNEWALRLFPALFGIAGCLMTYATGRLLFNRRAGLLSAIILATTPLYFAGAHYADLNLEVAVLISMSLQCFLLAIISEPGSTMSSHRMMGSRKVLSTFLDSCWSLPLHALSRGRNDNSGLLRYARNDKLCAHNDIYIKKSFLFAGYIFASLAFLTKGLIGVAFPALIGLSWMFLTNRLALLKQLNILLGTIIFLLIVIPWYALVQKANPDFLHYFFVTQQVTRFLSAAEFNNPTPAWFYIPILLIGFFPWSVFLFQALNNFGKKVWTQRLKFQTELFLLLWFLIVLIVFSIPQSKTIGYIYPALPPLALLVGHYLSTIWDRAINKISFIPAAFFIVLSSLLIYFIWKLPTHQWIAIPSEFNFYLTVISGLLSASILVIIFIAYRRLSLFISICAALSISLSLTLLVGAQYLNRNSVKPLALQLKTIMQPEDEVVSLFRFYQDAPIYLNQTITVVADAKDADLSIRDNWLRELLIGIQFQKKNTTLISQTEFWQQWESNKRLFVLLAKKDLSKFKQTNFYLIDKFGKTVLISNQPIERNTHNLLETKVKKGKIVNTITKANG